MLAGGRGSELVREGAGIVAENASLSFPLRVVMHFVTLCVTQRFCDVSWIDARLKCPFRPSATDFEGSK
ncbi:hypothetical protein B0B36_04995 [Pseudomonas syringae pv. actinidifoliorum]|nr:hypothetical protein B0B36_04995 [Pseudomonas syringae pv. actinidifoliorum]